MSESEIAKLKADITGLEARVAALENAAGIERVSHKTPDRTESSLGLTAVNRIGAVTLAVGVILFFKYAADNAWIGAGALVIIGVLIGAALIGAGEWLRRREQQAFAQGLAGCGVAILYICAYVSFGYYKLIPRTAGFFGMLAASAVGLALCFRFASSAVAAVGFIGAFLAPLLVRDANHGVSPALYVAHFVLLSIASIAAVTRLNRGLGQQSALVLAAFNAGWSMLCAWLLIDAQSPAAFVITALAMSAVYFAGAFAARETPRLRSDFYVCAHACFALAILRELGVWTASHSAPPDRYNVLNEFISIFLAIYAVVMIAVGTLRRAALDRLLGLVLLGIVVAKLYLYDVWRLTRFYRITAFVALGVLLLAASFIYSRFRNRTAI